MSEHIPFAGLIGVEVVSAEKEGIEARLLVRPDLCNPVKGLHGGAAMALADTLGRHGRVDEPAGGGGWHDDP